MASYPSYPPANTLGITAWGALGPTAALNVGTGTGPITIGKGKDRVDVSGMTVEEIREHVLVCAEELGYPSFEGNKAKARGSKRTRRTK